MKFLGEARRGLGLRATLFAIVLGSLGLLAACGGGTRTTTFIPARLLAFGDENSLIVDTKNDGNGLKYNVNALNDDLTTACAGNPLWTQLLGSQWNLRFPQCDPTSAGATGRILATNGARASDVANQIDTFLSLDSFHANDLVTMLAGTNDVIELYRQYPATSAADLLVQARARGVNLANQVNRIANAGGKVIISTIYDLGYSPFAGIERSTHTDTDRAMLLSNITAAFNTGLRVGILNDGRKIGLILVDELMTTIMRFPTATSFVNLTDPICDPVLATTPTGCNTNTVIANSSVSVWLWADNIHPSPGFQNSMGSLAATRAINNPF